MEDPDCFSKSWIYFWWAVSLSADSSSSLTESLEAENAQSWQINQKRPLHFPRSFSLSKYLIHHLQDLLR